MHEGCFLSIVSLQENGRRDVVRELHQQERHAKIEVCPGCRGWVGAQFPALAQCRRIVGGKLEGGEGRAVPGKGCLANLGRSFIEPYVARG